MCPNELKFKTPKPSIWSMASGFWDMKLELWAITGLSDSLWWPWLLSAQLSWLKALSLSWHSTKIEGHDGAFLFSHCHHLLVLFWPGFIRKSVNSLILIYITSTTFFLLNDTQWCINNALQYFTTLKLTKITCKWNQNKHTKVFFKHFYSELNY